MATHRDNLSEDDEVLDISPTPTFQRGYAATSPTSPSHPSVFEKIRNSVTGSRVKELKRQVQGLEEEKARLNAEIRASKQELNEVNQQLSGIVQRNPFSIYVTGSLKHLHVGDTNTLIKNPSTEALVAELEELTEKLTAAVQENTQERTNAEIKLRNTEVQLKEIKDSLDLCNNVLANLDTNTANKLGQVKDLLVSLTLDRSDDRIIKDGITQLRKHVIDRKRIVKSAESLHWDTQTAITRLVNKFGDQKWQIFADILDVSESSIQAPAQTEDGNAATRTALLDHDICARILAQWIIQSHDNGAEKLANVIKGFEAQHSEDMIQRFQCETLGQPIDQLDTTLAKPNQRSSVALSDTSTESPAWSMRRAPSQQLPDERARFEHQIESWKLQISMNVKLDTILSKLNEDKTQKKTKDTKGKQEEELQKSTQRDEQYV